MLSNSIRKLLTQLTDGLADIAGQQLTPEKRLSNSLQHIRSLLSMLREQVQQKRFDDQNSEIHFFKEVKPKFLSAKIFALEQYNIEQSKPVGTWEKQLAFYQSELEIINRCFRHHAYMYQYYRIGLTELDKLYFLRGAEVPSFFVPEFGEADPEFSTCGDYLFSKFNAYERLQEFILEQIRFGTLASEIKQHGSYQSKPLSWTGESINLVELGYGLLDSGQLNNGNAGVNDIFKWLEEHFGVSIGIPARRFVEIKRRKRLSRTRFLDNLRESVNRKIEEDEEYNPEKQQSRRNRQDN
ncbi:RteC domain-containing protein [Mucilaginibacter sp. CAU 1740]|uniref:RteC domain-containing protein n=1 Tax=Mucilaginibacter sp. CAU 1740 TaxID=3140365 RepID=UPI00325BAA59